MLATLPILIPFVPLQPGGIVRRTTFHVLALYAHLLGTRVGDAFVDCPAYEHSGASVPVLDAVATCDDRQEVWQLALVNRHPDQELACRIHLAGLPQGVVRATVLSGDSPDAYNDVDTPNRVVPYAADLAHPDGTIGLPAHSVTILTM